MLDIVIGGSHDNRARVYKITRENGIIKWVETVLMGHMDYVTCIDYHSDKRIVVTGSRDKSIRVWYGNF